MNKMTTARIVALPAPSPTKPYFAAAALALALLAIPHIGHAQGIVRGAQEGAYEGNRAAGPVGSVVGGAMGAVDGALGIPYRHRYHCRGFYDRYDHFHCYR